MYDKGTKGGNVYILGDDVDYKKEVEFKYIPLKDFPGYGII